MSRVRGRLKDTRDSELRDLKYKYYRELRDEKVRFQRSGKYLYCPYCQSERRCELDDLKTHASRITRDSRSASFRDKARHMGLLEYLEVYGDSNLEAWESNKGDTKHERRSGDANRESRKPTICPASELRDSGNEPREIIEESARSAQEVSKTSQIVESHSRKEPRSHGNTKELIMWPWMGIVANIPVQLVNGRYVADSGQKLKQDFIREGFNPSKVHPLWDYQGHSGFAIVEFGKDWEGFSKALAFEKAFEVRHHGKRDWQASRHKGDMLYGWLAREEEYRSQGLIGRYLQKNGDLKTVSELQSESQRKDASLLNNLANVLSSKDEKCEEIKSKITKQDIFIRKLLLRMEEITENHNNEMNKIQDDASARLREISEGHARSKSRLEARRQQLKSWEKELNKRQVLNEDEKKRLDKEKKMNEKAIIEQDKADEKITKLVREHEEEKKRLHKQILELEEELDRKQALQLEIERIRGDLKVRKCIAAKGDTEEKNKMILIEEELKDKEETLEMLDSITQALIVTESKDNHELQDARKELIKGLTGTKSNICAKRMGELDVRAFIAAARKKHTGEDAQEKAIELCSLWDDNLRDPSWHPYKVIMDGENPKELLDKEDEKVKELEDELGNEAFMAVTTALDELNEYNASGRYPVPELWNRNEKRKASLTEGIEHLVKQWKNLKAKRR